MLICRIKFANQETVGTEAPSKVEYLCEAKLQWYLQDFFQITDNLLKKLYFEIFKLTWTMYQEFQWKRLL